MFFCLFFLFLVNPSNIPSIYAQIKRNLGDPIIPSGPDVVRLNRRSLVPLSPIGLGDSKYNLPGFLTTLSISKLSQIPSGPIKARAKRLSAIRTRIERRIRECKVWAASSRTFRSPDNMWHADVVTCCLLLSEWLHFQREHPFPYPYPPVDEQ